MKPTSPKGKPRHGLAPGLNVITERWLFTADDRAIRYWMSSTTIVRHAATCGQRHKGKGRPKPTVDRLSFPGPVLRVAGRREEGLAIAAPSFTNSRLSGFASARRKREFLQKAARVPGASGRTARRPPFLFEVKAMSYLSAMILAYGTLA